jgi:hypothetical protein
VIDTSKNTLTACAPEEQDFRSRISARAYGYAVAGGNFLGDIVNPSDPIPDEAFVGDPLSPLPSGGAGLVEVLDTDGDGNFIAQFDIPDPESQPGEFGSAIAAADLDGDGLDEVIVGAPGRQCVEAPDSGAVYVFRQSLDPPDYACAAVLCNPRELADEKFGHSLASGDFDGDGSPELAVGAPGAASGAGAVYLLQADLTPTGGNGEHDCEDPMWRLVPFAPLPIVSPASSAAGDRFGASMVTGMLSEDAYALGTPNVPDSLAVGAPGRYSNEGAVLLFFPADNAMGGVLPLSIQDELRPIDHNAPSGLGGAMYGSALAVGDLDGSPSLDELAIGGPNANASGTPGAGVVCLTTLGVEGSGCFFISSVPGYPLASNDKFGTSLAIGNLTVPCSIGKRTTWRLASLG